MKPTTKIRVAALHSKMGCMGVMYKLQLQNAIRRDLMRKELEDSTLQMEITLNKRVQNCLKAMLVILFFVSCSPDKLINSRGEEYYIKKTCISSHTEMMLIFNVTLKMMLPQNISVCDKYRIDTIFTGNYVRIK